jgi:hypothetical protein
MSTFCDLLTQSLPVSDHFNVYMFRSLPPEGGEEADLFNRRQESIRRRNCNERRSMAGSRLILTDRDDAFAGIFLYQGCFLSLIPF